MEYNWTNYKNFSQPTSNNVQLRNVARTAWDDKSGAAAESGSSSSDLKKYSSMKPYLKDILRTSLITSIPQIVASKSCVKKCIKITVLCLCLVGFSYQTLNFLDFYLSYPTVVNVVISNPATIVQPAITFCNRNLLKRTVICENMPTECSNVQPDYFCKLYPLYCPPHKEIKYGMPFFNYFIRDYWYWEDVLVEAHNTSMINWCYKIDEGQKVQCSTDYQTVPVVTPTGPRTACYAIESQWLKPVSEPETHANTFTFEIEFLTEPEEYISTTDPIMIQLAVHERRRLVNPYEDGYGLRGGMVYEATVSMTEKEMLPHPYNTNCRDYIKHWKENNGSGPLNDMMCVEQCKLKSVLAAGECVDRYVDYPNMEDSCRLHTLTVTSEMIENCTKSCQKPCIDQSYEVRYVEVSNFQHECDTLYCKVAKVRLTINFKQFRVTKFLYQPKFESVEMFSYIGGYMGMWLGLSLISLFDLFQTFSSILYFPIGHFRWRKQKRKTNLAKPRLLAA